MQIYKVKGMIFKDISLQNLQLNLLNYFNLNVHIFIFKTNQIVKILNNILKTMVV